VVSQPGPLRAFHERTRARWGHGKAIVATARKLTVLFWCMLTHGEDYAHQRPALTKKKPRQLELTAGAPARTKQAAGIWSTNCAILHAERALTEQAEVSYKRMVPTNKPVERSPWVLTGQAAWFCSAPVASSQVWRTSRGVR